MTIEIKYYVVEVFPGNLYMLCSPRGNHIKEYKSLVYARKRAARLNAMHPLETR